MIRRGLPSPNHNQSIHIFLIFEVCVAVATHFFTIVPSRGVIIVLGCAPPHVNVGGHIRKMRHRGALRLRNLVVEVVTRTNDRPIPSLRRVTREGSVNCRIDIARSVHGEYGAMNSFPDAIRTIVSRRKCIPTSFN